MITSSVFTVNNKTTTIIKRVMAILTEELYNLTQMIVNIMLVR